MSTLLFSIAQLRHAYTHLYAGKVVKQREFATGILGRVIPDLEKLYEEYHRDLDHMLLLAEALAEIKAVVDGQSTQSVKDIVYGVLAEIEARKPQPTDRNSTRTVEQ